MDDIVKQALAKWPNVPHCYGWLGLDARGNWYMRDDRIQALGPFADGTLQSKGSLLKHEKLIDFIQRNYETDDIGQWFFQNGPQRVYLQLQAAPWVWRVQWQQGRPGVTSHTGLPAQVRSSWLDEQGRLYLDSDIGLGIVHSQDMIDAAQAVEQGLWQPQDLRAEDLPQRFGFVLAPQPPG